jgi:hypothetical protein
MIEKQTCFVIRCKNKTALARARGLCNYSKIPFRTVRNCVVIYTEPKFKKQYEDIEVIRAVECEDLVGNIFYIKKD